MLASFLLRQRLAFNALNARQMPKSHCAQAEVCLAPFPCRCFNQTVSSLHVAGVLSSRGLVWPAATVCVVISYSLCTSSVVALACYREESVVIILSCKQHFAARTRPASPSVAQSKPSTVHWQTGPHHLAAVLCPAEEHYLAQKRS